VHSRWCEDAAALGRDRGGNLVVAETLVMPARMCFALRQPVRRVIRSFVEPRRRTMHAQQAPQPPNPQPDPNPAPPPLEIPPRPDPRPPEGPPMPTPL